MAFVDDEDVQIHLPVDKLAIEGIPDDLVAAKEYGARIVRAYLSPVLEATTIAAWTDPATTPELIRLINGLLTASKIYRDRYSEDSLDDPEFAQQKYNEAMQYLRDLVAGNITLDGITDTTSQIDDTWFQPNDGSTDQPKFTMSSRF